MHYIIYLFELKRSRDPGPWIQAIAQRSILHLPNRCHSHDNHLQLYAVLDHHNACRALVFGFPLPVVEPLHPILVLTMKCGRCDVVTPTQNLSVACPLAGFGVGDSVEVLVLPVGYGCGAMQPHLITSIRMESCVRGFSKANCACV